MDDRNEGLSDVELTDDALDDVSGGGPRESMQMEYELYKRNGGTLTEDDLAFDAPAEGELEDEELAVVAGGGCEDNCEEIGWSPIFCRSSSL